LDHHKHDDKGFEMYELLFICRKLLVVWESSKIVFENSFSSFTTRFLHRIYISL